MKDILRPLLVTIALCGLVFLIKSPLKTLFESPLQEVPEIYLVSLPYDAVYTRAVVTSVADGDTLTIDTGERVRLLDIDTPELSHPEQYIKEECYGKDAGLRLSQLVDGKEIILLKDRKNADKYDRLLRYILLPMPDRPEKYLLVNAYLIGEGFARVFVIEDNTRYKEEFFAFQDEAKDAERGLWGVCDREKFRW